MLRTLHATRYVTPLREGGSLPAIVEADDDGLYVLKFHGAGQGPKALIAELIAGEIARALGLLVPELVFIRLDPALGRSEPDYEIRSLITASSGLNLALDYLPGALTYTPAAGPAPDADLASAIVWLDAYVTNVDRTPRNTNLLRWHGRLWLIDHGAALYFHHTWSGTQNTAYSSQAFEERSRASFPMIKDHVLLPYASAILAADARLTLLLSEDRLAAIVALIPDEWLDADNALFATPEEHRAAYQRYLVDRLRAPRAFAEEAAHAYAQRV
jgi:hypothetical protein